MVCFSGAKPDSSFTVEMMHTAMASVIALGGTVSDSRGFDPTVTHCVAPIGCQSEDTIHAAQVQ